MLAQIKMKRLSLISKVAHKLKRPIRPHGQDLLSRLFFLERDLANTLRYGLAAPKSAALIYVDPRNVTKAIHQNSSPRIDSGRVKDGDWDIQTRDVNTIKKVRGVRQHLLKGIPWEKTSAWKQSIAYLDQGLGADGIHSLEDVRCRYDSLDELVATVQQSREAAFRLRKELRPGNFREAAGIMVNVDRNGDLLFGMRGCHRLAVAQALELTCIPAQLGIVHKKAVVRRVWQKHLIEPKRAAMIRRAAELHPKPITQSVENVAHSKVGPSRPYYPQRYGSHTSSSSIEYGANRESHWSGQPIEKFARLIPILPGATVVEVGAAEGILSLTIAPHKERVRAIDIATIRHERGIRLKERWLELGKPVENCEMVLGDILEQPGLIEGFDTLVASRVVYYFGDRLDEFMTNVARNVRHVCLIGNPVRAKLYKRGIYKELGEKLARYADIPGMIQLVERYGFKVATVDSNLDPLVIAHKCEP